MEQRYHKLLAKISKERAVLLSALKYARCFLDQENRKTTDYIDAVIELAERPMLSITEMKEVSK